MTLLEEGIFAESFGVRVNTSFLGHFLEKICHVKFYNGGMGLSAGETGFRKL